MSIVANRMIIDEVRERLADKLTAKGLEDVTEIITDVLANYEILPNMVQDTGTDMMLDAYIDAMDVEGLSKKTLGYYRLIIKNFLKRAGVNSGNVTQYHIRQYLATEKARGIKDSTIRNYCWVFSAYFGWLHRDGIIQRNPMNNIGRVKVQKKVREVFSEIDIEKLKNGCLCLRDKAIVCFLKSTGCRISEVTALNRDDIDFQNLECIVLGKGNKERRVYIDLVTGMILKEYLESRQDLSPALFTGRRTDRLKPGAIRKILRELGERTGVEHVHPHKFRATQLTELANRGMPIEQVKMLAGHEKIDTTMGYVRLDQENVKNSYRKYA